jgi:hypothetical protein
MAIIGLIRQQMVKSPDVTPRTTSGAVSQRLLNRSVFASAMTHSTRAISTVFFHSEPIVRTP